MIVDRLLEKAARFEPASTWRSDAADRLTPYATAYRYPGTFRSPSLEQVDEALDDAACIYNQVLGSFRRKSIPSPIEVLRTEPPARFTSTVRRFSDMTAITNLEPDQTPRSWAEDGCHDRRGIPYLRLVDRNEKAHRTRRPSSCSNKARASRDHGIGKSCFDVYPGRHWDDDRPWPGRPPCMSMSSSDRILDPETEEILQLASLKEAELGEVDWNTRASGDLDGRSCREVGAALAIASYETRLRRSERRRVNCLRGSN